MMTESQTFSGVLPEHRKRTHKFHLTEKCPSDETVKPYLLLLTCSQEGVLEMQFVGPPGDVLDPVMSDRGCGRGPSMALAGRSGGPDAPPLVPYSVAPDARPTGGGSGGPGDADQGIRTPPPSAPRGLSRGRRAVVIEESVVEEIRGRKEEGFSLLFSSQS